MVFIHWIKNQMALEPFLPWFLFIHLLGVFASAFSGTCTLGSVDENLENV